ncbi:unnamed protein product [Symbiodinium microadriaticum]|nr:unnamed protein product [Symbiodinium microadriaticum]
MSYVVKFWDASDFCFPCRTVPLPDFLKKSGVEESDWTELLGSLRSCRSVRENPFAFFFYWLCHILFLGAAIHGANHRKIVEVITQAEDGFNQKCSKKLGLFVFVDWRSGELIFHPPPEETAAPVTAGASQPPQEKSWYQAMTEKGMDVLEQAKHAVGLGAGAGDSTASHILSFPVHTQDNAVCAQACCPMIDRQVLPIPYPSFLSTAVVGRSEWEQLVGAIADGINTWWSVCRCSSLFSAYGFIWLVGRLICIMGPVTKKVQEFKDKYEEQLAWQIRLDLQMGRFLFHPAVVDESSFNPPIVKEDEIAPDLEAQKDAEPAPILVVGVISKPDQVAMDSHTNTPGPEKQDVVEADETNEVNQANEGNATNESGNVSEAITRI